MKWAQQFHRIQSYFWYLLIAKSYSSLHSPLLFRIAEDLLSSKYAPASNPEIEIIRKELINNQTIISKTDFGAGSIKGERKTTTISSIAKTSLSSPRKSIRLARLAKATQSKTILELGTSLGINTLYISKLNPEATIFTLEGDPVIAGLAAQNFKKANAGNIISKTGTFNDLLPTVLEGRKFDFVFLDGDHRLYPSLDYINAIIPHLGENAVLVMDDIHWSAEMSSAWLQIKSMPTFTYSLDLYEQGWLFKLPGTQKQDFVIRTKIFGSNSLPSVAKSLDNTNS